MGKNTFTFTMDSTAQKRLVRHLQSGNYLPTQVPHAQIAADTQGCRIVLYKSGKCVVQGKGAEEWVTFTLEPQILMEAKLGYEEDLSPESATPHIGVDESGKGDFFGPLVIAAAYVDPATTHQLRELEVKDSKQIKSDKKARDLAVAIRKATQGRFSLVTIGPSAYNRLYDSMRNVNRILAWGHARAIENLLDKVPDCPRAVADQFGPEKQIQQALMKKGKRIKLEQRPRAESDPAVAAASILARAGFIDALRRIGQHYDMEIPKGASDKVQVAATELVASQGAEVLLDVAKCHFRTTDKVLEKAGLDRSVLGDAGSAMSKAAG